MHPIRRSAPDPGYGGESVGGISVSYSPSTASFAVSDAILSHVMLAVTGSDLERSPSFVGSEVMLV